MHMTFHGTVALLLPAGLRAWRWRPGLGPGEAQEPSSLAGRYGNVTSRITCVAIAIACLGVGPPARAQTRRALLVGIGHYPPSAAARGARGDWPSLDGAVNDVEAMRDVLVARYGFHREEVVLLLDGEATREAILGAFRRVLIEAARPGDTGVFFYAGHGSFVRNSLSREPDRRDETIVAFDGKDVRDKELARLMGEAADRKVALTAFFDSCHSGSISRGGSIFRKVRAVEPDPNADARDPEPVPTPAQKGFLVVSAAQDYQNAVETLDDDNQPHGAFTAALLSVLRSAQLEADAEGVFEHTRALLRANGITQDPLVDASPERRRSPLFGSRRGGERQRTLVTAGSVNGRDVEVLAGFAIGLAPGALLARSGDQGKPPVRLRVEEVTGISRSIARAASEADATVPVSPGDLFRIERWVAPSRAVLRVYLDPPAAASEIRAAARALWPLRHAAGLQWLDDPSLVAPTHVLYRDRSGWRLRGPEGRDEEVGAQPSAAAIARRLAHEGLTTRALPRLFVRFPAPSELASRLGGALEGAPILRVTAERDALYVLAGRVGVSGAPEYAWVLATAASGRDLASSPPSPLPRRGPWQSGAMADPASAGEALDDSALRIARVRAWLTLAPPPQETEEFPYRLALRRWGAPGLLAQGEILHGHATCEPVLVSSPAAVARGSAIRYVYLLVIDSSGHIGVLYPSDLVSVNNRFPSVEPGQPIPTEIALGDAGRFRILPPYGPDTYVLLATEEPLGPLSMLEQPAITRGRGATGRDALGELLNSHGGTRGKGASQPGGGWSIDRLNMVSAP